MGEARNVPEERTKAGQIFPGVAEAACLERGKGNLREPNLQIEKEEKGCGYNQNGKCCKSRKAVGLAHSSDEVRDSKTLMSEGAIL